jgi:hypothetical protein
MGYWRITLWPIDQGGPHRSIIDREYEGHGPLYLRDALKCDREDGYTTVAMDDADPFLDYVMIAEGRFDRFLADVHQALARVLQ